MTSYSPIYTSANNVYAKTGLSSSEVDLSSDDNVRTTIEDAEIEVERLTGRKFTSGNTETEYFSIERADVLNNKRTTINLSRKPIQSITALQTLDSAGNATNTFATLDSTAIGNGTVITADYWIETSLDRLTDTNLPNGKITLISATFPSGINVVKATYTYGYSSVPVAVRDLATCLAGIRAWIRFMGGQYNRMNDYSIPQQSANKGDFYQRAKDNMKALEDEATRLLDIIGRRTRIQMAVAYLDR